MKYNLHPKLSLEINTKNKGYSDYFNNEYSKLSNYEAGSDAIVIKVTIGSLPQNLTNGDRRKSFLFKKLFNQKYIIRNLEKKTVEIFYKDSFAGKVYPKITTLFLQTNVIEPIIYLKLLEKNILFMHAAGVSDGKYGYLFPAYGGTGKTTLTLGLMAENMPVLGDDLILVDTKKGLAYPYLRPLHLFAYNIKTLRDARIPFSLKLKIKIKDILRFILEKLTRQEFLIATRVHAESLYPDFKSSETVKIRKLVFLKKTGKDKIANLSSIDELSKTILESEDLNDSLYRFILNKSEMSSVKKMEVEVIKQLINTVGYFEFVNTRLLDFNDLKKFKSRLVK